MPHNKIWLDHCHRYSRRTRKRAKNKVMAWLPMIANAVSGVFYSAVANRSQPRECFVGRGEANAATPNPTIQAARCGQVSETDVTSCMSSILKDSRNKRVVAQSAVNFSRNSVKHSGSKGSNSMYVVICERQGENSLLELPGDHAAPRGKRGRVQGKI